MAREKSFHYHLRGKRIKRDKTNAKEIRKQAVKNGGALHLAIFEPEKQRQFRKYSKSCFLNFLNVFCHQGQLLSTTPDSC